MKKEEKRRNEVASQRDKIGEGGTAKHRGAVLPAGGKDPPEQMNPPKTKPDIGSNDVARRKDTFTVKANAGRQIDGKLRGGQHVRRRRANRTPRQGVVLQT